MSVEELVARLGLPLGTFVYCVVSGFVPVVNAELFLVGVAAVAPRSSLPTLALLAAAGQMVSKSGMYLAGRGVLALPKGKRKADLEAIRARVERWRSKDLFVFVSASLGLPPLFATAILAGTLRLSFPRFVVAGLLGRFVRFGLITAIPPLGRWLTGIGTP